MTDKIAERVAARSLQAKGLDLSKVEKIRGMTQRNDHSNAYVEGAKLLGAKHLEKKFKLVADLVDLERSMPRDLGNYQYALYRDLLAFAKQELPSSDYDLFYRAF